jgi:parallel beta-helix repeat protein
MKARRFVYLAAAVSAVVGVLVLAGPAGASRQLHAANPPCATAVGSNITLTGDMTCPNGGIIVGANDITINLGGYTLTCGTSSGDYCIDNSNGYSGVTVENGSISGGYYGIWSDDAGSNTYTGLTVSGAADTGIYLEYGTSAMITGNTITGNTDYGLYADDGASNTISGNVVSENGVTTSSPDGIYLEDEAADTISGNYSQSNIGTSGDGANFIDYYSDRNTYSGNYATSGGYGYYIYGDGYGSVTMTNNAARVTSNEGFYLYANFSSPDASWDAALPPYSMYSGNWAYATGSYGWDSEYDYYATYDNNSSSWNANGTGEYGFYFYYPYRETITNNTANNNSDSGFYLSENYTDGYNVMTFSDNSAQFNGDYGFYADYGAPGNSNTGGGTNSPADCYNVAGCS